MLQKTRSIVLSHLKYGDSGLIVRTITENQGRLSFIAHGVRKKKSKFNPYLFEPLSLLDIELYYKANRDLHTLKEAKPSILLQHLYFDIKKSTIAIFLSEILSRSLQEVESNKSLFNFIFHAVQILDVAQKGIENFHLIFLIQFSKFIGIYPKNNQELIHYQIDGEVQISDLLDHSLTDIDKLHMKNDNRSKLLNQLVNYFRHHLEGMAEIKSLAVLRTVFH